MRYRHKAAAIADQSAENSPLPNRALTNLGEMAEGRIPKTQVAVNLAKKKKKEEESLLTFADLISSYKEMFMRLGFAERADGMLTKDKEDGEAIETLKMGRGKT